MRRLEGGERERGWGRRSCLFFRRGWCLRGWWWVGIEVLGFGRVRGLEWRIGGERGGRSGWEVGRGGLRVARGL